MEKLKRKESRTDFAIKDFWLGPRAHYNKTFEIALSLSHNEYLAQYAFKGELMSLTRKRNNSDRLNNTFFELGV